LNNASDEIDIEKLLGEIRAKFPRARSHMNGSATAKAVDMNNDDPFPVRGAPFFNVLAVRSNLAVAEARADIGSHVTPMRRFYGPLRWLALIAGRVVVYLSSFLTDRQRVYNRSIINALNALTDGLVASNSEMRREIRRELQYLIHKRALSCLPREKSVNAPAENVSPLGDETGSYKGLISDLTGRIRSLESAYELQEKRYAALIEELGRHRQEIRDRKWKE
jgi:hypothetical protein